jgi:Flp pilus assembly protein TadD
MQRELFVEERVKAVLWLTTAEANNLARHAPDFWAFRHRVVEFVSQRSPAGIKLPAGVLLWDTQTTVEIFDSPEAGIRAREDLLARLPRTLESLSTRTELYYSIGYLRWIAGDLEQAARAVQAGLDLAADRELPELKSRLLNGVGIVHYEAGNAAESVEDFKRGLQLNPSSPSLLTNLAAACCMLGRKQEATAAGKKAIAADPADAETRERVAYILAAMGKPDEAITHLLKTVDLAPRVSRYRAALAVLYSVVDRVDEARVQLESARSLTGSAASHYLDILQAAILGDGGKAGDLLKTAVQSKEMAAHDIRRDPNLAILLDAAQLAEFSE